MAFELDLTFQGTATLYAVIRKTADGTVWNGTASVTYVDANVALYDVALTNQGGDYYAATMPAAIPAGNYRVTYYEQAGGTPAITDLLLATEEFFWNGTATSPVPVGGITVFGTRAGVEQKVGVINLAAYADLEDDQNAATITAAIEDDLAEAATDMRVAWREYTDVALDSFNTMEERWLADTNEYGAAVKAYNGRTVQSGQNEPIPEQIATALQEWQRRLQMLRDGTVLLDYQDEEDVDAATVGGIPSVALSDGSAAQASDLPILRRPYGYRPYVWP